MMRTTQRFQFILAANGVFLLVLVVFMQTSPVVGTSAEAAKDEDYPTIRKGGGITMARSLKALPLSDLLNRFGGCNTHPHICSERRNELCCRGRCRNVHSDAMHCGRCGRTCPHAQACCGGSCVDLNSDAAHCGSCDNFCYAGVSCQRGLCGYD
ncbi:hypothetical protein KP509_02G090300 [Ceratopteris richardii]|uniref:Stigma-specific STIG1-like protein 1 n=1 Tax=Ceratopteris richardii TaxID=49495 RepID=A0A8T2VC36_CERRI|nr:hypothetical protein KP509_02G090300 [Ceratopteris richardii]